MKKFIQIILIAVLCAVLSLSVFADDIGYNGELDRQSGQPTSGGNGGSEASTNRITVGGGSYDKKTKMYYYRVGQAEIAMSVPSGLVTTGTVCVKFPEGLDGQVYLDGALLKDADLGDLESFGSYVILAGGETAGAQSLTFTIVKKTTGAINGYRIPDGFTIAEAKFNGEPIECAGFVDMTTEGRYDVVIRNTKASVTHTLSVSVDHTAPTLKLEAVKNGVAKGPVDLFDAEGGASVIIYRNGDQISYTKTLTKTGDYRIEVRDAAGNRSVYEFTIGIYFNFSGIMFLALVLIGIGLLLFYLRMKNQKLRIR